jgi:hypothetical protein
MPPVNLSDDELAIRTGCGEAPAAERARIDSAGNSVLRDTKGRTTGTISGGRR